MKQEPLKVEEFYDWRAKQEVLYASEIRRGTLLKLTADLAGNCSVWHGDKLLIKTSQPYEAFDVYNKVEA